MTRSIAGLRYARRLPTWDLETYSEAGYQWNPDYQGKGRWQKPDGAPTGAKPGLPLVGAAVYSEHPTADVLMIAYDLLDGRGERQWFNWQPAPADLSDHIATGQPLEAHNAGFEYWMARNVLSPRYGFPLIQLEQLWCSMAKARAWSLPPSLGQVADVLNVNAKKDKDGARLMKIFSMPRNPTLRDPRRRVLPHHAADEFWKYAAYNITDIRAEAAISERIPDLTAQEREYYLIAERVNHRGIHVDTDAIEACIAILQQAHARYNAELCRLTGGAVPEASKREAFLAWLATRGLHTNSLDEEHITYWLKRTDEALTENWGDPVAIQSLEEVRRALEIRAQIGSASVKKVYAMRFHTCSDGRMRDLEIFHGARTGRPTGVGPQPTNLPRSGPNVYYCAPCARWFPVSLQRCPECQGEPSRRCSECEQWVAGDAHVHCGQPLAPTAFADEWNADAMEQAIRTLRTGSLDAVEAFWGEAIPTLSACLRGLYNAAPGHELIGSDYSAIEAVVNAALAGEQWRLDVFRTHGKIYEASAANTFKLPVEELLDYKKRTGHHHPLRQKGKVTELALGYLGWIGALRTMGFEGSDEEAKELVIAWRDASPAIVYLGGGQRVPFGGLGRHPVFGFRQPRSEHYYGLEGNAVLSIRQPGQVFPVTRLDGTASGLAWLTHADVLYLLLPDGTYVAYHRPRLTQHMDDWRGLEISFEGYNTNPTKGPIGWIGMTLYAGVMLENACQAVANRILRFGQVQLEAAGYPIVLHVYDENIAEVPIGFGTIEHFEHIMSQMPPWAADWPIKARGGWRGQRYRK
jgi:DNA polymerase